MTAEKSYEKEMAEFKAWQAKAEAMTNEEILFAIIEGGNEFYDELLAATSKKTWNLAFDHHSRYLQCLSNIDEGHKEGYPDCCIRQFIIDAYRPYPPVQRYPHPKGGHNMCDDCAIKEGKPPRNGEYIQTADELAEQVKLNE